MDDSQTPPARPSAVSRAERLLDQFGQRLEDARRRAAAQASAGAGAAGQRPAVERAEETLDRTGERVGLFAARATYELRKLLARTREEAEDLWAEAQSARNSRNHPDTSAGNGPHQPPPGP